MGTPFQAHHGNKCPLPLFDHPPCHNLAAKVAAKVGGVVGVVEVVMGEVVGAVEVVVGEVVGAV